jgi:outer membrane protein assembly factor BamA
MTLADLPSEGIDLIKRATVLLFLVLILQGLYPLIAVAKIKIIPLPAFSTTKNEGETYGNLTAFLFTNEAGEIYAIMAPFVVYNKVMGVKSAWQLFGYMSGDRDFVAKVSYSTKINREFRFEYRNPALYHGHFIIEGGVLFFKESTARFFGLGQESHAEDETNFTQREMTSRLLFGINFTRMFNLTLTERYREVKIELGGIDRLPFIGDRFPALDGLSGATIWGHRLTLTHDRRDDRTTPTQGEFMNFFGEWGHVFREGHITPFSRYGLQAKGWFPFSDKRLILVPNVQMQWLSASNVPFFERSTLGGEDTLRAYGLGRFVDDHFILMNLEGRVRITTLKILDVTTEGELAPFVDTGKVYSSLQGQFFDDWEVNPGLGMRLLVRPNVVGRFDVAFGREGTTFFVGLNFPF